MDAVSIKIGEIEAQFEDTIGAFRQAFIAHHTNPSIDSYAGIYADSRAHINSLTGQLGKIVQDLQSNMRDLRLGVSKVIKGIDHEQAILARFGTLPDGEHAAEQYLDDSRYQYKDQWIKNLEIICGVLLVVWIFMATFRTSDAVGAARAVANAVKTATNKGPVQYSPGGRPMVRHIF